MLVGAITELAEGDAYHWSSLMAAALMGSLPVVISLLVLRRILCVQPNRGGVKE